MDLLEKGWFTEVSELWPNQRASFKVEKILVHEKSKYQDILIFKTFVFFFFLNFYLIDHEIF